MTGNVCTLSENKMLHWFKTHTYYNKNNIISCAAGETDSVDFSNLSTYTRSLKIPLTFFFSNQDIYIIYVIPTIYHYVNRYILESENR